MIDIDEKELEADYYRTGRYDDRYPQPQFPDPNQETLEV